MNVMRSGVAVLIAIVGWMSAVAYAADLRLVEAAERNDAAAVEALLSEDGDVNAAQPDGATALHWAAHWDAVDMTGYLLRAGAAVDAVNELGVSPLSVACRNGSAEMVKTLLSGGADARAAEPSGETVLMT